MIPELLTYASNIADEDLNYQVRTSKTWKLDKDKKRVTNELIDEQEAVKQATFLHLGIENKSGFIHTAGFGVRFQQFYGKDIKYVETRLPDVVKDALAWDERIIDVSDFEFEELDRGRILKFSCVITSYYGDFTYEGQINV